MSKTQATTRIRSLHGKNAAARRWDRPDRDEIARDYAAARIENYIMRVVAECPPLTDGQRERIALLLTGGGQRATFAQDPTGVTAVRRVARGGGSGAS